MIAQGYRHLITARELKAAEELLAGAGLSLPEGIDTGLGYYEDGALAGTAFLCGNLICGVCVDPSQRGGGLAASLVGRLVSEALENGLRRLCIFTKADEADKFAALGFQPVAATAEAALLEFGSPLFEEWAGQALAAWRKELADNDPDGRILPARVREAVAKELVRPGRENGGSAENSTSGQGRRITASGESGESAESCGNSEKREIIGAVVMNANPFTMGHRALVEEARKKCDHLLVFVVEEDASVFPFPLRLRLVWEGVADLPGVSVLPGGPYMVSRASFPAYFTGQAAHARIHAALDATIFAKKIAPLFGIGVRFVGSEPYCRVTSAYNGTLQDILPRHGVRVEIMERKESGGEAISASKVRALMRAEDYAGHPERFAGLVPPSTLKAILGPEGQKAAKMLRERLNGRH